VLLVNASGTPIRADSFGGVVIPPDGTLEIEDGYCDARLAMNGSRIPSLAERLLVGMVPADAELRAKWGKHLRVSSDEAVTKTQEAARLAEEHGLSPAAAAGILNGTIEPPPKQQRGKRRG